MRFVKLPLPLFLLLFVTASLALAISHESNFASFAPEIPELTTTSSAGSAGGSSTTATSGSTSSSTTGTTTGSSAGSWTNTCLSTGTRVIGSQSSSWTFNPSKDEVHGSDSVSEACSTQGGIAMTLTWSGQGDPPATVWLQVTALAWAYPDGTVSNGYDTTATMDTVDYLDPNLNSVVQLTAKVAKTVEIKEFSVDEDGKVMISKTLNAASSNAVSSKAGVALSVVLTDRKAVLNRPDNGKIDLVEPGKYEAHTLLSWTGNDTEESWNYTQPTADGSPGDTWAELRGVASGSWSIKEYTEFDPPKTGDDILVKWSGSSVGSKEYGPPIEGWVDPVHVRTTTYDGKAPYAAFGGNAVQNETWKYSVEDRQDKGKIELECKWFYHYAHENWHEEQEDGDVYGPEKVLVLVRTVNHDSPPWPTGPIYNYSIHAYTYYQLNPFASPGFTVHRNHVGIPSVRNELGKSALLTFDSEAGTTVSYDGSHEGGYKVWLVTVAPSVKAKIDVWTNLGAKTTTNAFFAPVGDFIAELQVEAPASE